MSEIILHHYAESPFAEKTRLMFGSKGLAWRSVSIPVVMPKPDLLALTGGYRRTPVMQIGSDIYCDTALIGEVIERKVPAPALFPPAQAARARLAARWADSALFSAAVSYAMQPAGLARLFPDPSDVETLLEDRKPFLSGGSAQVLIPPGDAASVVIGAIDWIETELGASGGAFIGGASSSILDFSLYHGFWFIHQSGLLDGLLADRPYVAAWVERVRKIGHGKPQDMNAVEAIAVAASSSPVLPEPFDSTGLDGLSPGDPVTVAATDYGVDPTSGRLVTATRSSVVVAREDARAGKVHVHFPRMGFRISRS
ncbi:MAG: glutathione S-transferase family protein [Rhodocyclaceae bacterium]|jgi:glutathione S-transferase|nr:glutathione S-transferase family protein [Rhodocyclaceae bacterium]